MKALSGCLIGLVFGISASAEPLLEGRVRLESGQPVADAQVQLFDLTNLRQGAIARAMTNGTGYFALPLSALMGRALPERFALGQNYPNPFNPSTIIPYQLAASSQVRLEVFNLLGQRIAMLVDGERPAGFHTAMWHATDAAGRAVGAGVYIYRMTVGVERQTGRMVLVDGQAGLAAGGAASVMPGASGGGGSNEEGAQVYGLLVSGEGLAPYVDSSFRVEAGMAPVELVVSSGHWGGKAADDDCAFCDLFDVLNDDDEGPSPSGKAQAVLAAPPAPTNLRFDAPTDSSCRVRWDAAEGATDYDVNYKPAVGGKWTNEPHRGTGLYNTINDLEPDTEYRWAVRAENDDGRSEWVFGPNFTTLAEDEEEATEDEETTVATTSLSSDRDALVALYNATDGPNWTNSTNWLSDKSLGDWHGVTVANGRVTELALGQNQLTGSIPSELGNLTSLQYMSLWENQLTGPIPSQLGRLTKLYSLGLGENQLTGEIPPELGQLTELDDLSFAVNHLTGPIPHQLGQLTKLTSLQLQYNLLTGSIPTELGNLQGLTFLSLRNNLLTGPIPSQLGRLTKLEELFLDSNQLTGEIPPELGQLTKLKRLFLDSNRLTGEIPPELGQLTKLIHLGLSFNQLSGPLPEELIALPLEYFALAETQVCVPRAVELEEWLKGIGELFGYTHCGGRDPQRHALSALYDGTGGPNWKNKTNWLSIAPLGEWYGVTTDADGRVTELNLEDNNLSGTVPLALAGLANLKTLNLAFNASLSGPLPQAITGLPLESLRLEGTAVCAPPQAEFQAWLNGISETSGSTDSETSGSTDVDLFTFFSGISGSTGVALCTDTRVDYYALVELYNATDGPNWTNATNWAYAVPLNEWHGVGTDPGGRVIWLTLQDNNLRGPLPTVLGQLTNLESLRLSTNQLTGAIPPELGQLTNLSSLDLALNQLTGEIPSELVQFTNLSELNLLANQLTGEIPPELGQLTNLTFLELSSNQLTGAIPSELGQLANLEYLSLVWNPLTGEIPSELGQLTNLEYLSLGGNQLTGAIPPELGQLTNLESLDLGFTQLTGAIPSELGQLSNLESLELSSNQLTGEIPPELGRLTNLERLQLQSNLLTGEIPSELGRLTHLSDLNLSTNQLTGAIPSELGQLPHLSDLNLSTNLLTGEIPPELGRLTNLSDLNLSSNLLTGNIPPELVNLGNLRSLNLAYNGALSGTLPHGLTGLTLEDLRLNETLLCPPQDADFQAWLFGIPASRIPNCARVDASTAYLTQATQSLEYPVPLVAGEAALLRVFVTAAREVEATMPPVRATFYRDGAEVHTAEMEGRAKSIPWQVNEGDLSSSANALVPGSVVMPGLEMVVEIDPDQTLDAALGVGARLPPTGRTPLNVRSVPPFDLTLVPFLWTEQPDSTILTRTEGLTSGSDLFRLTRDILPVGDFSLTVHEPVWTSVDPTSDANAVLGPETELIYAMEGASGYYMAIFRSEGGSGLKGQAQAPGYVSQSILDANTIAHELGHNLSLDHAPGCGTDFPDLDYPYEDGSIGVWGYDFLSETLVSPGTSDIMTYCDPQWISEYSFAKAMGHRSRSASPLPAAKYSSPHRGLLLWGGLNESGELFLEPAFVVGAPPLPPRLDGPYRLTGEDEEGDEIFTQPFGMPEYGCGGRGGSFAFILPVGRDWPDRLARIVLSGPEGVSILDGEEDPSAALLLDHTTGSVRGVLRDWPEAAGKRLAAGTLPEPGLEVLTSRGLPEFGLVGALR